MPKNRIALIQVWIGPLPDYFQYHYETCLNQRVDFFFFTDQESARKYEAPNFKVFKINLGKLASELSLVSGKSIEIKNHYKLCDLKPTYADVFSEYVSGYDFVGYYDIDTLLGDVASWFEPYFEDYDVISFGEDDPVYKRISGPLVVMRNDPSVVQIYRNDHRFDECMKSAEYAEYDERLIMQTYRSLGTRVKLVYEATTMEPDSKKIRFDSVWTGGKIHQDGRECLLHHFWRKSLTNFKRSGNSIITSQKTEYLDDFYYITYFTKNYEPILMTLIKSLEKFSKRRCILYTVNYDSDLIHTLSEQFIIRRIDITGDDWLDERGRSFNVLTLKPKVHLDSLKSFPGKKFVFLDTDIYVTAAIDGIVRYFDQLETYPLSNSHVHDEIHFLENGNYYSSLHILGEELDVEVTVFPRRKANIMVYDERSKWFFEEQIDIYEKHKDSKRHGIFKFHDEDLLNILLCKYHLTKSLHITDLEETYDIDLSKIFNYSYSDSLVSESAVLPRNDRDVYVFHGYKTPQDFQTVDDTYSMSVLDRSDILVDYKDNELIITKNSVLSDKLIDQDVMIRVLDGDEMLFECDWNIFATQFFHVWDFKLQVGNIYTFEISETKNNRLIYRTDFRAK